MDANEKSFAWIKNTRENFSAAKLHTFKYARAMNIQKYNASAGWLDRFQNYYGFKNFNLHG